jgi:hypothetical protein
MNTTYDYTALLNVLKSAPNARKVLDNLNDEAQNGNVAASFELAMHYLNGTWDLRSIQDAMVIDKLIPATEDPNQDPYLIAPRDYVRALYFCRQVVYSNLPKNDVLEEQKDKCKEVIDAFDYAKNPNQANNPYLNEPFRRPENLKNSIDAVFFEVAVNSLTNLGIFFAINLSFTLILSIIAYAAADERIASRRNILVFGLLVYVPTIAVGSILYLSGVTKFQPCCSCKKIRSAYGKVTSRLPECFTANLTDPFESTNWFVRNTISIFLWYCAFGLIVASTVLGLFFYLNHENIAFIDLPVIGTVYMSFPVFFLMLHAFICFTTNLVSVASECKAQNDSQDLFLGLVKL